MKLENEQASNEATSQQPVVAEQLERVSQDATPHQTASTRDEHPEDVLAEESAYPEETRTLPFIVTRPWEKMMVESWHDETLNVHIVLMNYLSSDILTPEGQLEIEDKVDRAIQSLPKTFSLPMAQLSELSYAVPCVTVIPPSLADRLTVKQRRWLHNGLYLQVGFSITDYDFFFDLGRPIATAMTLLDSEVVGSNSVFVAQHEPKKLVGFADRELAYEIGLVFEPILGVADWNNSLIPLRNELLVKLGAVLRNLDPKEEYRRFVNEGHDYFLDFTFGKV